MSVNGTCGDCGMPATLVKTALVLMVSCLGLVIGMNSWVLGNFESGFSAYNRGDYETALKEYQVAAERGDERAQINLGAMYAQGQGVPQSWEEAARWYGLAAKQGNESARVILAGIYRTMGAMHAKGQGRPQDQDEALRWFRLAAEYGDGEAQTYLAAGYATGTGGLNKDLVLAYFWADLGTKTGNERAMQVKTLLEKEMTPEQMAEAERLVGKWKPKTP